MIFNQRSIQIFESVYNSLFQFHSLMQNHVAVIAYSGGKDSSLLSYFYQYLFSQSKCPEPILFHMDHSIRDNLDQEKEIELEMKKLSGRVIIKKKKFQSYLKG